jgi:hypothetical protein
MEIALLYLTIVLQNYITLLTERTILKSLLYGVLYSLNFTDIKQLYVGFIINGILIYIENLNIINWIKIFIIMILYKKNNFMVFKIAYIFYMAKHITNLFPTNIIFSTIFS